MSGKPKILIVDDDKLICSYIEDALLSRGFFTYIVNNIQDAKRIVQNEKIDLLITDLQMKGGTGIDLIRYFRLNYPTIPSIVITAFPGEDYVKVMEEMEVDTFLTKPFSADQIRYSVLKGLEKRNRHIESLEIKDIVMTNGNLGLFGTSQYLFELRKKIRNFALGEFAVLIQGPSGTGKEIIANAMHSLSARRDNPIVTLNCPAIPEHLEESEFFGHARGAYTGAYSSKNGIIAAADGSTLFLDEIGELSLSVQAKLLRVLENGEYFRIGETIPKKANIRLITATNRDLKKMVEQGPFREDLFFRLGVVINTKPLMEHKEDIPTIVQHIMDTNVQNDPRSPGQITSDAMAYLVENHWQGNVRELKQSVNLLCHTSIGNKRINITDVKSVMIEGKTDTNIEVSYSDEKLKVLREFELDYFTKLLKKYRGNISQASRASGMHRPNLIKKLKILGISSDDYRGHKEQ